MLFKKIENKRKFFVICLIVSMIFGQASMSYAFDSSDRALDAQNNADEAQKQVEESELKNAAPDEDTKNDTSINQNLDSEGLEAATKDYALEAKPLKKAPDTATENQTELRDANEPLPDAIKKIEFTDSELLDTLGIRVGSDYVLKAINLAKEDGKAWKDLTSEEREAYYNKAKAIILKEKISNNIYLNKFNEIKNDVIPYLDDLGVSPKSEDFVRNNKHHFVMGLAYLEKLYNIPVDNTGKTLKEKLFDNLTEHDRLQAVINLGKQSSTALDYRQISTLYNNVISVNFKKDADFKTFLINSVGEGNKDAWFENNLKPLKYIDKDMKKGLFDRFADYPRTLNHILPLLNLPKESIYLIVNDASITYGLYDTYVYKNNASDEEALAKKLNEVGEAQKNHIKILESLSNNLIPNRNTVVKDALRTKKAEDEKVYEVDSRYTSKNTWAGEYDTVGLREFFTPLNMYSPFVNAGAVAESPSDIRMLINRALDFRGLSAYSHELIHLYNKEYLQGNERRLDTQPELYPRGLLESFENDAPIFGLNLIYENRNWMNSSYKQFTETTNIEDNIKNYMHNQLDLIYSLEIIEANELIKRNDKADYLKKLTQANGPKTQAIDTFSSVSNLDLKSVNDFVDNDLVVKRYDYSKRTADQSHAENNDYHTIPLFSSFYAGSENPNGSVGDVSLRRLAFELLGEFGYTDGFVPYMSNKYMKDGALTDSDILPKIFNDKYTSMKAFKKEMYNRRSENLKNIKDVSFEYGGKTYGKSDIERLMKEAIEKDKNLNGQNPTNYTFGSNVEKLKKSIYSAYKKETRDFRENIYDAEKPKANKSELEKAIKSAEDAKKDIKTSTDGKDVEPTDKWTTAEAMKALNEAIAEAKKVDADENAKQTDVDAQKEKLDKAIEKFKKSVKAGLKVEKANKSELEKAIKSAEDAKKDIKTSTDGKDVEPTDKWTTAEAMKALNEAIAEAKKVDADENAKQTDVDAQKEKLDKAIEKFKKSVKAGLKVEKANKSELEKAIKSAEDAKKDIKTSTDGKDVEPTDKWTTAEAMKALNEAIAEAKKVDADENAKQTDVDAQKEKLDKAIEKFQKSVKAGLKVNEPSGTKPNPDVKNPSETNPDKVQNDKNKDNSNSEKNKSVKPNNGVKTGDTANAMGYIGLGIVALGAVYIIARKNRSL